MAYNLFLNGPVPTWAEFGGYSHARIGELRQRLRLTNAWIDPLTGFLSASPKPTLVDDSLTNWPTRTGAATWTTRKVEERKRKETLYYPGADAWTATSLTRGLGEGFSLYIGLAPLGDQSNDSLSLQFGGGWKLILTEGQEAELLKWNAALETPAYESLTFFESPIGSLFEPFHLWIYSAGDRLIFHDWKLLDSGFCWIDPDPELGPGGIPHALRAGAVTVGGTGRVLLAQIDEGWEPDWTAQFDPPQSLMTPSTQGQTNKTFAWKPEEVTLTLTVYDQEEKPWPTTPSEDDPERTAFYWTLVSSSTDTKKTAFVGRVEVDIARLLTLTTTVPVDLKSIAQVTKVELQKSRDPKGNRLTATVKDRANLSTYIKPAMRMDFVRNGTTLHTGLLLDPGRTVLGPPGTTGASLEQLDLTSSEVRRLEVGTIFNMDAQDGADIAAALRAALEAAAIPAANITTPVMGFLVPTADPEEEPCALPSPGDSPLKFLEYLLESYAADYTWRPGADFTYEILFRNTTAASVATFYRSHAAAAAAGFPNQYLLRGLKEVITDAGFANMVIVVGQNKRGDILLAADVKWEYLRTEPPYLPIIFAIVDENLRLPEAVARVCRQVADRVFRRMVRQQTAIPYYPLEPGDRITISGTGDFYVANWTLRLPSKVEELALELEAA